MFNLKRINVLFFVFVVLFLPVRKVLAFEIHDAAAKGDLKRIRELLDKDPSLVSQENDDGFKHKPIQIAVINGHLDAVKLLVSRGADVNSGDVDNFTVLHEAAAFGYSDVVGYLISKGADVNAVDNDGCSVLYFGIIEGNFETVERLLKNGAEIKKEVRDKFLFLQKVYLEKPGIFSLLVKKGWNVNIVDNDGKTLLHHAVMDGDAEGVRFLLSLGADMYQGDSGGNVPLYYAILSDKKKVAGILMNYPGGGAESNDTAYSEYDEVEIRGENIFFLNVGEKNKKVKKRYVNEFLKLAIVKDDVKMAEFLIKRGADVNGADNFDRPPICFAVKNDSPEMVRLLADNGADLKVRNSEGDTLLHLACSCGSMKVIRFLVDRKADVNAKNNRGISVLEAARNRKFFNMPPIPSMSEPYWYLIRKGAVPENYHLINSLREMDYDYLSTLLKYSMNFRLKLLALITLTFFLCLGFLKMVYQSFNATSFGRLH